MKPRHDIPGLILFKEVILKPTYLVAYIEKTATEA